MHPIFEERAQEALGELTEGMSSLGVISFLNARLPGPLARQVAALYELRSRAHKRFPTMSLPYLTQKGFSQASSERVARWRAERFASQLPGVSIFDMTCGIGADSLALAFHGMSVLSADLDFEHLQFTRANLEHHGFPGRVVVSDAACPSARADLCLIDPDRRQGGRRMIDPCAWSPRLGQALAVAAAHGGACLKLAPALDPKLLMEAEAQHLPRELPRRREWLSRHGELVEISLWTGTLAGDGAPERIATRLDNQGTEASFSGSPHTEPPLSTEDAKAVKWIGDPDPALLRSGLLGNLARECQLAPMASQIAYLAGQDRPKTPFLRVWRVLDSSPIDRKQIRSMLRRRDIGPISVRKRGHPDPPEVLERRFRGKGTRRGELLIARLTTGHRAFLVEAAPD